MGPKQRLRTNDRPEAGSTVTNAKEETDDITATSQNEPQTSTATGNLITTSGSFVVRDVDKSDEVAASVTKVELALANTSGSPNATVRDDGSHGLIIEVNDNDGTQTRLISNSTLQNFMNLSDDGSTFQHINLVTLSNSEDNDVLSWKFANTGGPNSTTVSEIFDFLSNDETLTLTYFVTLDDGQSVTTAGGSEVSTTVQKIIVEIKGTNDQPEISGSVDPADVPQPLTESDSALTVSNTLNIMDIDTSDVVLATVTGVTAMFSGDGAVVQGGSTVILDPNDPANNPGDREITQAQLLNFMNLSDGGTTFANQVQILDNGEISDVLTWRFSSSVGVTPAATGETFDFLSAGETLQLTYTIRVSDQNTQGANDEPTFTDIDVVVTITGTNDAPVVTSAAQTSNLTENGLSESAVATNLVPRFA